MPPKAGPMMVAVCQAEEFHATAFWKWIGRHEVGQQRLTGRVGERAGRCRRPCQRIDRPDLTLPLQACTNRPAAEAMVTLVADEEHGAAVEAVGHVAGDQRQADRRQEAGKADQPQRQRIMGQIVDQPADGHVLHLDRQRRQEARGTVEREIGMAERGPTGGAGFTLGAGLGRGQWRVLGCDGGSARSRPGGRRRGRSAPSAGRLITDGVG